MLRRYAQLEESITQLEARAFVGKTDGIIMLTVKVIVNLIAELLCNSLRYASVGKIPQSPEMKEQKDAVVDFKQMGIDHIFVDESHQFKNLMFNTRHDRVAGLGNSEGSQRALNLLYAIRTIQERTGKDLGATFLVMLNFAV